MNPKQKIILAVLIAFIFLSVILGLLWYYQKQGIIKVFPTAEDQRIKKVLSIDNNKFISPEGLSQEKFETKIAQLYKIKTKILEDTKNSQNWFEFGYAKEFLNDHLGAEMAWEIAFDLQPQNFVTALNLGNVNQYFLKDYPKSEYYYLKTLELKPDHNLAYQGLADLYRFNWKEKQDQFEPIMLKGVEKDNVNQISYYANLVEFFADKEEGNDIDKAREYLGKIEELKPELLNELLKTYPSLKK